MSRGNPRLTGLAFYPYAHKLVTTSFTPDKCRPLRRTTKLVLSISPIMVHIVGTILRDCIFGGLISFRSPIFPYWDIVNNIKSDVISLSHIHHFLDVRLDNQTPLLYYLNYLRYLQQSLKSFFSHCNFIVLSELLPT